MYQWEGRRGNIARRGAKNRREANGKRVCTTSFTINISGIKSCQQTHSAWINILRRARQLEHDDTARDRADIRVRVLDIVAGIFGMTIEAASANINQVLSSAIGDSAFEQDFRLALMKDFDIELNPDFAKDSKGPAESTRGHIATRSHIEGMVLLVQRELEIEAGRNYPIRVLPAGEAQIQIVRALLREFEEKIGVPPAEILQDENLNEYVSSNEHRVLIATYIRQTQGFIMLTLDSDGNALRLERLYVKPEARGKGIGPLLVRRALEVSAEQGSKRVVMNPLKFSGSASGDDPDARRLVHLLEREGFSKSKHSILDYEYVVGWPGG